MNRDKEELLKDLIKQRSLEPDIFVTPIWDEMAKEHVKKSIERKKQLMQRHKVELIDMIFDLEDRNEFLLHNLSEVEKMYNKLKEEEE